MASVINRPNGHRWVQFTDPNKRRKTIRLGKCSKRNAEKIKTVAEDLLSALITQNPLMPDSARWVADASDDIYEKLSSVGLLPERETNAVPLLRDFLEKMMTSQNGIKKAGTISNNRQVVTYLLEFFGDSFDMASLKKSDVNGFRDHLVRTGLSNNTIARHIGRMKQFWNAARDAELLDWKRDPFAGQKTQVNANEKRFEYVSAETVKKVIDSIADREWKLILALCRFAGFRCPSEVLELKWDDINWEQMKIFVDSAKTGPRWCPIFPDVYPYLRDCFENASDGAKFAITRYRSKNANLRTQLERWCKAAAVDMWGKPFQNLRSSCEIDLNNHFPMHVVARWLGHSESIAFKHYLRTTDDDFKRAASMNFSALQGEAKPEAVFSKDDGLMRKNEAKTEAITVDQILSESIRINALDSAKVELAHVLPKKMQFAKHPEQDSNLRPTD